MNSIKKILFPILAALIGFGVNAQDIIIKKNGEELYGKVTEITPVRIYYKDTVATDTTVKFINKSFVLLIRYANGINEVIKEDQQVGSTTTTALQPSKDTKYPIKNLGGNVYSMNGRTIKFVEVKRLLLELNDPEIRILLQKARTRGVFGNIMAYASIPVGYFGVFLLGFGVYDGWYEMAAAGGAMTTVFIMSQVGNPILKADKRKKIAKAIELYNARITGGTK